MRISRYSKEIRAGLIALALPTVVVGAWALFGPHSFHDEFPGGGREWIAAYGPYNEHMVRDFGSLYLGLGLLLVFAAVTLSRPLVLGALGAYLVFSLPHFVFHATETRSLSSGDVIANIVTLGLGLGLTTILLWLTLRAPERTQEPARDTAIEGGVTYGTR